MELEEGADGALWQQLAWAERYVCCLIHESDVEPVANRTLQAHSRTRRQVSRSINPTTARISLLDRRWRILRIPWQGQTSA